MAVVEPDLQGMRAFVAAAEESHFGRAAARLFLTQQALSKRVRRLEESLGSPLFDRTTRRVELTPAGRRFLPLAREVIAVYDTAVEAMREAAEPLRVDVYAERFTPLRLLREAMDSVPGLRVEPSMRQGLATALPAVLSGEIDAAFGRVHDLGRPWPPELDHRPVLLTPMHAFVLEGHSLASRTSLRMADLREGGISMPDPGGSTEWRGYLTRLSEHFGVPLRLTDLAMGLRDFARQMRRERLAVAIGEAGMDLPSDMDLRRIPIVDPAVLHLWSITWRRDNRSPGLRTLLQALPAPDPGDLAGGWLPEPDRVAWMARV
jgi:DNA-binding transcriptional LysR family regulator